MMTNKIRVLIVDDSAIVRKILSDTLSGETDIEVVGTAPDPIVAQEKILALKPHVLTLDIEMPRMDGITFLKKLMASNPMPVIIISSLAQAGCSPALAAMDAGAVEVLGKPAGPSSIGHLREHLAMKVRSAAQARVGVRRIAQPSSSPRPAATLPRRNRPCSLIAIGASTGGTEAVRQVLSQMGADLPPIVIVQHIPPVFSKALADRLNKICPMEVREAQDGDRLHPGLALVAPGDFHMVVRRAGLGYAVEIKSGPRVCYQRPAVDVLFTSVAETAGAGSACAILTGMGSDGANGLLRVKQSGGLTLAQDEATCVVYGMPREAIRLNAADRVLPLNEIGPALVQAARSLAPAALAR